MKKYIIPILAIALLLSAYLLERNDHQETRTISTSQQISSRS